MNINEFNQITIETPDLVWYSSEENEKYKFVFTMGNGVEDDENYYVFEEQLLNGKHPDIKWGVARGDDIVSWISCTSLAALDSVQGLEEFILDNLGPNCYTDE